MSTVTSKDGTEIAFSKAGAGPALILVDGALCYREFGPAGPMANALKDRFTVYTYDRRGRGESGNHTSYSPDREIEDLEALLKQAGGSAYVFGCSSGAALALAAANRLSGIRGLVLYEAPFIVDGSREPMTKAYWETIALATRQGDNGGAVSLFFKAVGVPGLVIVLMRLMPMWGKLKAVAPTLPNDGAFVQEFQQGRPLPQGRWSNVNVPTLVMDGGKSPSWMRNATKALAAAIPGAEYRTLAGQTHMVKPQAHAPVLKEFFLQEAGAAAA